MAVHVDNGDKGDGYGRRYVDIIRLLEVKEHRERERVTSTCTGLGLTPDRQRESTR
jgi:hypothetical protein